jgi:Flp pilus assembly secretin CpaC
MRRIYGIGMCAMVLTLSQFAAITPASADAAHGLRAYRAGNNNAAAAVRRHVIYVDTDFLKPIRFSQPAGNLVVGNPLIADVIPRDDQYVFISGKSAGHTNLLVYDKAGTLTTEYRIHVRTSQNYTTLINGAKVRSHFECLPKCERVLRVEDSADQLAPCVS